MIDRLAAAVALIATALTGTAPPASAQTAPAEETRGLSAEDMRVLAQQLLAAGRPSDAGQVLNALLAQDPRDAAALILGAQAALDQNQPQAAVDLAVRGFRAAPDDTARFVAARLAALAHATLGQDTRAQVWLRRARQTAPDAANAASVAQDYAFLRNRNPLAVQLQFGISPSNNINNGSRSDTVTIGPFVTVLSESAKPLSGVQFNAGATLRYRLAETETAQTFVTFDASTTTYALSQRSRDALKRDFQDAVGDTGDLPRNGSDFAYTEASASLTRRQILRDGLQPTDLTFQLGRSWYGGDPYQIFVGASVAQTIPIGQAEQLRVDAFYRYNFADQPERFDDFGQPITSDDISNVGAGLGYTRALAGGDLASVSLSRRISRSDNAENDFSSWRIGAGLDLGQPIANVRFGFGAQFEERKFDRSFFTAGIRRDRIVTGQVSALFDGVEYYGFSPVVTLSAGRTFSKAERFDTDFANIGVDLRSAF